MCLGVLLHCIFCLFSFVFDIYLVWDSLSFLHLWFDIFHYFWKIFSHCFLKYLRSLLSFPAGLPITHVLDHLLLSHSSWILCFILFFFLVWVTSIDFSSSSLILSSAVSSFVSQWRHSSCTFQHFYAISICRTWKLMWTPIVLVAPEVLCCPLTHTWTLSVFI